MPRDMNCPPADMPAELPLLSKEEELLVEAVAAGDDNSTAYRKAYGAEGYSPNALKVRACRKIGEAKIQAHLRALRSVGFASAKLTLEARIKDELAFAQRAEDAGNWGAAGGAHDRVNKLMGLYIEKHEDVTKTHDPMATLDDVAARMGEEVALAMAKHHKVNDWIPPSARGQEHASRH